MLNSKIIKNVFITASIFLLAKVSFAAPSINSVYSENNGTITIAGTGFGIKAPAEPLLWETFEDGKDATSITNSSNWVKYGEPNGGLYSNADAYSGNFSAHNRVYAGSGSSFNTSNFFFDPTDEIYYSYMSKFVSTGDSYGQFKNGRTNAASNKYNGAGATVLSDGMALYDPGSGYVVKKDRYISGLRSSTWTRHEMYKRNSTPGVADGEVWWAVGNNNFIKHYINEMTRGAGYDFKQTSIILGLMYSNVRNDGDHKVWVDDVYVDNTRARVEIGNDPVFANCSHREIQIPSAWIDEKITVTLNQGSFTRGTKAYLFVVDADGKPSSGFPITIGSEETTQSIKPPTNLSVSVEN